MADTWFWHEVFECDCDDLGDDACYRDSFEPALLDARIVPAIYVLTVKMSRGQAEMFKCTSVRLLAVGCPRTYSRLPLSAASRVL